MSYSFDGSRALLRAIVGIVRLRSAPLPGRRERGPPVVELRHTPTGCVWQHPTTGLESQRSERFPTD